MVPVEAKAPNGDGSADHDSRPEFIPKKVPLPPGGEKIESAICRRNRHHTHTLIVRAKHRSFTGIFPQYVKSRGSIELVFEFLVGFLDGCIGRVGNYGSSSRALSNHLLLHDEAIREQINQVRAVSVVVQSLNSKSLRTTAQFLLSINTPNSIQYFSPNAPFAGMRFRPPNKLHLCVVFKIFGSGIKGTGKASMIVSQDLCISWAHSYL